ncbi:Diphthamide synthase domain [Trinorchestia longiramus]|nr:Diphthamide synthase domain [Trinorchestia longiramus]
MKFIGLISGGKDGFYSIKKCIDEGHKLVGLLYINSKKGVIDSYMYQTVGFEIISSYQHCVDVPLFIYNSDMNAHNLCLDYKPTEGDEVEDLYQILINIMEKVEFEAISSGAIASNYQKSRIENVAHRLGILTLTPLWNNPQDKLLSDMISAGIVARVAKVANPCLDTGLVGKYLEDLISAVKDFDNFNFCGEGGEYETICEYAPFFRKRLKITKFDIICDTIEFKPSSAYYMKIKEWEILDK